MSRSNGDRDRFAAGNRVEASNNKLAGCPSENVPNLEFSMEICILKSSTRRKSVG